MRNIIIFLLTIAILGAGVCFAAPLQVGFQVHIEEQMWRPCDSSGFYGWTLCREVISRMATLCDVRGAKLTVEYGLGLSESSALWGGPSVPGSIQWLETTAHEVGVHIHYPAGVPGTFRGIHCFGDFPEDTIPESLLTFEEYLTAIRRRVEAVDTLLATGHVRGQCGALSSEPALRWIPAMDSLDIEWVSGWVNMSRTTSGHYWDTRLTPRRVARDETCDYSGGILNYDFDGPIVHLPDGSCSGRLQPNHGYDPDSVVSWFRENLARADDDYPQVCYLTFHAYEFIDSGSLVDSLFDRWEIVMDSLAAWRDAGLIQFATFSEMYDSMVAYEAGGGLGYPANANFETTDTFYFRSNPVDSVEESLVFFTDWIPTQPEMVGGGITDEHAHDGTHSYEIIPASDEFRGIVTAIYTDTIPVPVYARLPIGETTTVRFWVKAQTGTEIKVGWWWYDDDYDSPTAPHTEDMAHFFAPDDEWNRYIHTTTVPFPGWGRVVILCKGTGSVFVDDCIAMATDSVTSVPSNNVPPQLLELNVFPNPFNSSVAISAPTGAEIEIYDITGSRVWGLGSSSSPAQTNGVDEGGRPYTLNPIPCSVIWQPGQSIASGIYLVKARTSDGRIVSRKVAYLK